MQEMNRVKNIGVVWVLDEWSETKLTSGAKRVFFVHSAVFMTKRN